MTLDEIERAARLARVSEVAAQTLGGLEAAHRYLRTRNFALGGIAPIELLRTSIGEEVVLDELQAHGESGPL